MTDHAYNKRILKPIAKLIMQEKTGYPMTAIDSEEKDRFDLLTDEQKADLYQTISIVYRECAKQYSEMMQIKYTEKKITEIEQNTLDLSSRKI